MIPKARRRRALVHVGGETRGEGDAETTSQLVAALDVPSSIEAEEAARAHVHGFHSYPARMHPRTAERLVAAFARPGGAVLDPFCGSGTVLVEARLSGRAAIGVDANPLAVRLSRLKTRTTTAADRARLVEGAWRVAAVADERRKARSGASHRFGPADVALFEPHVLLELDGLRLGLDGLRDPDLRADLELVLSAILVKLSRKTSDTSEHDVPRRIAAGYPARLFVRKTEELAARLAEVEARYASTPLARVLDGDARVLAGVADRSAACVVTSPPYPGVYDYVAHHAARLRWLRLRGDRFEEVEIGSRRRLDALGPREARARWHAELGAALGAMARVLEPGAPAILLLADSVVGGAPVYALDLVRAIAPAAGFSLRASASQPRPHFHAPTGRAFERRPREEHAIALFCTAKPR